MLSRVVSVLGASLAVTLAVLSDLTAAEAPTHALTLAAVAAVVVAFRTAVTPWCRHVLPVLAAIVTLQPALHGVMKLVPSGSTGHTDLGEHVDAADVAVNGTQVALALVVVAVLGLLQRVLELVTRVLRVLVVVLGPVAPEQLGVRRRPAPGRRAHPVQSCGPSSSAAAHRAWSPPGSHPARPATFEDHRPARTTRAARPPATASAGGTRSPPSGRRPASPGAPVRQHRLSFTPALVVPRRSTCAAS